MEPALLIPLYCALIVPAVLLGGALPRLLRLTHTRMQVVVSFVAGLMLGVSLFHMLPHATYFTRSVDQAVAWVAAGLLGMFFLIRIFHFHEHEMGMEHGHPHPHDHAPHRLAWVGVAAGLGLHTAIDGVALSAATLTEAHAGGAVPGVGTFLAVLLHKPLDALAIASLMTASGSSPGLRRLVNVSFALMLPLGAGLFALGVERDVVVGCALAFSAGVFLCISLADLLPEVQFHTHDRVKLSVALLLGVALAYAIGFLEAGFHDHAH